MRKIVLLAVVAVLGLVATQPATARINDETESGFIIRLGVDVPASPEDVWDVLVRPEQWWDGANTFSGDAANLSLEPRAGGCFCEVLPNKDMPEAGPRGSAEHMRVVYVEKPRALRMIGALGPLQPDAVTGAMTIVLQSRETGTRILWEYAVAGHFRKAGMAAAMDAALTAQILRLGEKLGARAAPGSKLEEKGGAEGPADADVEDGKTEAEAEADAATKAGPKEVGENGAKPESADDDTDSNGEPGEDKGQTQMEGR